MPDLVQPHSEVLPRQGPGNRTCAARALSLCKDLPASPAILDLGCGVGGQTLHLADLTSGSIVAIDSHAPSIERLKATVAELGLAHRVCARLGDVGQPEQPPESFELIWSEGALYNIAIEHALRICQGLLRLGGYLGFTDTVWRKETPPPQVTASFDLDYPAMGWADDIVAAIRSQGFELLGHFTLPDDAWREDFYAPMRQRIEALRGTYAKNAEASAVLDKLAKESEMHRRYSDYYGYEFFIARRAPNQARTPWDFPPSGAGGPTNRTLGTLGVRTRPAGSAAGVSSRIAACRNARTHPTGSLPTSAPTPRPEPAKRAPVPLHSTALTPESRVDASTVAAADAAAGAQAPETGQEFAVGWAEERSPTQESMQPAECWASFLGPTYGFTSRTRVA